jgi:hypothetical protein
LHLAVFDAAGSKVIATYSPLALHAAPLMLEALTASRLSAESPMREWTAPSGQRLLVTMGAARFANGESAHIALLQDLLKEIGGRHDRFREADIVIRQEHHLE